MYSLDDTIAAISTPLGEGGIGLVRMSGPAALPTLQRLFRPGHPPRSGDRAGCSRGDESATLIPYRLHYGHLVNPATGEAVDEVLAVYMPSPGTYTRQDVVEIDGHGGIVALRRVLSLCLRQGVRLAEPGEFTVRAFLNGRIDLAQAEAVLDVVRARTDRSLQAAVAQLDGRLSAQVAAVRTVLVGALAQLEASIDFAEDEVPERDIGPDLDQAARQLDRLLADADTGILYRQGVRAAIVGRPNVGKSSLLNCLLRTSRAIVTNIPGTTRDTLEETLNLQGLPIVLVDTAGIAAHPADPIERLGIERSRAALAQADLALFVIDASQPLTEADQAIAALVDDKPAVVVMNKVDLLDGRPLPPFPLLAAPFVGISATSGAGLESLEAAIVDAVLAGRVIAAEAPLVTSTRHKEALSRALDAVRAAYTTQRDALPADLVAIDLVGAVNALGEITGQTASEDLLETIFSSFCIGK